jgi:hypothetical protein
MAMPMVCRGLIAAAIAAALGLTAAPAHAADPPSPDQSPDVSVTIGELPSDGSIPRPPSRDVDTVKKQQGARTAAGADLPSFQRDRYTLHQLTGAARPSWASPAPLVDGGLHDAKGVRMFSFNGQIWNHPVFQGAWGLSNVTSYVNTGTQLYLDRAIANAQRNLDRRVESRGAWWYPYDFDLSRCVKTLQAPWYSAMAQGRLLSLFVRLWEITGDAKWREAADNTLTSLTLGPDAAAPWATWVDDAGYLWLDEYPESPGTRGERVMNGHITAMYGLYDYWAATGDQRAADLFDGAATAVRRYLPNPIRNVRWASNYSLGCLHPHLTYHVIHTGQALELYGVTWAPVFAKDAYLLRSDYPVPTVAGNVRFFAGTHIGYRFNSAGTITGSKSLSLSKASGAPANQRIRVYGRNYYYRVTAGAFAGYLVPETAGARELRGKAVEHTYDPTRVLVVQPGTYTAYAYSSTGTVIARKTVTFSRASTAPLGSTAWVNGRLSYRVTAGAFSGYWLPHTTGLAFR